MSGYHAELAHAISALQVLTGQSSDISAVVDLNNDNHTGIEDVIAILNSVSE